MNGSGIYTTGGTCDRDYYLRWARYDVATARNARLSGCEPGVVAMWLTHARWDREKATRVSLVKEYA